jgi:hypothetical protein
MAVTYDNSVSATDFGVTTITTGSFTIGAGSDRYGIACLSTLVAPGAITTATMGGVSGSAIASATGNDGTWWHVLYAFANPASGSQTVTFTWANASSAVVTGITAAGVGSVNGGVYGQAAANNVSINVASSAGDLTVSFSGDGNTGTTHSTNQTIRVSSQLIGADTGPGTAGPITHTWTHTGAFACNAVGANFVASGGAAAVQRKNALLRLGVGR